MSQSEQKSDPYKKKKTSKETLIRLASRNMGVLALMVVTSKVSRW
jgi:hypothetical protein